MQYLAPKSKEAEQPVPVPVQPVEAKQGNKPKRQQAVYISFEDKNAFRNQIKKSEAKPKSKLPEIKEEKATPLRGNPGTQDVDEHPEEIEEVS